ncbi:MAG: radical SAM protein [Deltaproteobacteria bacterium]|jgi:MoaA/NifB/PqqE/SkfB family radical SAM enzyme|nr:radical SAM protein [Deltaproteobacteria bacterium]MBW2535061.1 radical SAM protein [Deltaproteobacteria bacterium]
MSQVRRIDVKTGFQCNNRCWFCVQGDKRFRFQDKTTAEVAALLEEGRRDADEVVFTGGEVTIRSDLPELVRHARSLGFRVIQVQTNGRMLSHRPFVEALVAAGVTEFGPALHGPTAAIHDGLTRAPGSFRQTVKGIRNVKCLGLPVITNSVITRGNFRSLPELARLFIALEVDQYQFAFVHPLGTAAEHFRQIVPRLSEVQPYVLRGLDIGVQAGVRCMTEAVPLCFLPGVEHLAAEAIIPRTKIFDAKMVVDDYTEFRLQEGKAKGEVCQRCLLDDRCEGPWREYPDHYGWDEFNPVR